LTKQLEGLTSGRFVLGPETEALEAELAAYTGAKHCICVSSGSDALYLALMATPIITGVIHTTPFTFIATTEAILKAGLTLRFCDIDDNFLMIHPDKFPCYTLPVSLFGHPWLKGATVLDNAKAYQGLCQGSLPVHLSFFPTKNLGGISDGGAVLQTTKTWRMK
jgi:UDP-2-acetamido-2-deoxy-ribo-hexuluronate aminotransferase